MRILRAEFIARLRIKVIVFMTEEWGIYCIVIVAEIESVCMKVCVIRGILYESVE